MVFGDDNPTTCFEPNYNNVSALEVSRAGEATSTSQETYSTPEVGIPALPHTAKLTGILGEIFQAQEFNNH